MQTLLSHCPCPCTNNVGYNTASCPHSKMPTRNTCITSLEHAGRSRKANRNQTETKPHLHHVRHIRHIQAARRRIGAHQHQAAALRDAGQSLGAHRCRHRLQEQAQRGGTVGGCVQRCAQMRMAHVSCWSSVQPSASCSASGFQARGSGRAFTVPLALWKRSMGGPLEPVLSNLDQNRRSSFQPTLWYRSTGRPQAPSSASAVASAEATSRANTSMRPRPACSSSSAATTSCGVGDVQVKCRWVSGGKRLCDHHLSQGNHETMQQRGLTESG